MDSRSHRFGKELKRLRELNNLTQEKFAEKINVSRETVNMWENGNLKRGPYLHNLWLIVENSDIDPHVFAHAVFDVDSPGEMGELVGDLKELCSLIMGMTEDERSKLLSSIKKYVESKDNLFSFDMNTKPISEPQDGVMKFHRTQTPLKPEKGDQKQY